MPVEVAGERRGGSAQRSPPCLANVSIPSRDPTASLPIKNSGSHCPCSYGEILHGAENAKHRYSDHDRPAPARAMASRRGVQVQDIAQVPPAPGRVIDAHRRQLRAGERVLPALRPRPSHETAAARAEALCSHAVRRQAAAGRHGAEYDTRPIGLPRAIFGAQHRLPEADAQGWSEDGGAACAHLVLDRERHRQRPLRAVAQERRPSSARRDVGALSSRQADL